MPRVVLSPEYPVGNGYAANTLNVGWSNNERTLPAFWPSGTSSWHGKAHIGEAYASGAPVRLRLVCNEASGNPRDVRMEVAVEKTGSAGSSDDVPNAIAAQTITVAATRVATDASFAMPFSVAIGDTLTFKITRFGDHANDTLALSCFLWDAWLADA